MARRLQEALRRDAEVRRFVAQAQGAGRGRPLYVWNGDWLRSGGQEGKGLAGLRQVILVAVGFAPPACRNQAMRGHVILSLSDAPGSPRIALGAGAWRWSDLLFPSTGVAGRRQPKARPIS